MLTKKHRISKKDDFQNLYKNGNAFYFRNFKVFLIKNDLKYSRFSVITPKKTFPKATTRNKIKRKLKNLVNLLFKDFRDKNFDFLIIVNKNFLDQKIEIIENELLSFKNKLK